MRFDGIGDYILFRNFIEIVKHSKKFEGYSITLLGNISWKPIAEEFDNIYIDEFIWINLKRFKKNLPYRFKKLTQITKKGYEIVVNTSYSRDFSIGDSIVNLLTSNERIGCKGDLSNINPWQKKVGDTYYTKLLSTRDEILFEFNRNKEFFENLLELKLDITRPSLKLSGKQNILNFKNKYAILFIGASANFRKWNIENFAEIAIYLFKELHFDIVLCGGKDDLDNVYIFKENFPFDFIDLVGKTSLLELVYIINGTELIISNETSVPHLAVSLNVKNIIVISNGNHFGRFTPYPKNITNNYHTIFHSVIGDPNHKIESHFKYGNRSKLDINEIKPEEVINKLKVILG